MSRLTRTNSVGEEDDDVICLGGNDVICIDGEESPKEYEIDSMFLESIGHWHSENGISKGQDNRHQSIVRDTECRQLDIMKDSKNKNAISRPANHLHINWRGSFVNANCFETSKAVSIHQRPQPEFISDRYREHTGEHRPKVQRQSSTEIRRLNTQFDELILDGDPLSDLLITKDDDGDTLLAIAIILQYTDLALMVTNIAPSYNVFNTFNNLFQTALHIAALTNNVAIVRRLIVAGADVTVRDRRGNTALHIACTKGYIRVAKSLLEPVRYPETKENAYQIPFQKIPQNLELRNSQGLTCLLISAERCDKPMMDLLLSKYANINAFDMKNGKTCLHMFAETGNLDMVKYLMSHTGLDVNQRTFSSFTAVELASYRGHGNVVSYLLYHGCDPDIRSITSGEFDADSSDSENNIDDTEG